MWLLSGPLLTSPHRPFTPHRRSARAALMGSSSSTHTLATALTMASTWLPFWSAFPRFSFGFLHRDRMLPSPLHFKLLAAILTPLTFYRQLLSNWRHGNADSLSVYFLGQWLLGDTLNLVGSVMTKQLPTQARQWLTGVVVCRAHVGAGGHGLLLCRDRYRHVSPVLVLHLQESQRGFQG